VTLISLFLSLGDPIRDFVTKLQFGLHPDVKLSERIHVSCFV
jgi:hypothetical protein